jgi:hypothetical protein
MTVCEGGGKRAIQRKFQDVYVPALKANFLVWPAVQLINFRVMPIQFQIVSTLESRHIISLTNTTPTAIRLHNRNRLDSLPLPHQLRRGSRDALGGCVKRLPLFFYGF